MNNKLVNWWIGALSAVGVLAAIPSIVLEIYEKKGVFYQLVLKITSIPIIKFLLPIFDIWWINSVSLVVMIVLVIYFIFYKRRFVNLYGVLNTISYNNKLHPIRMIVVVVNQYINNNINRIPIKKIIFVYNIYPSIKKQKRDDELYDVRYSLKFEASGFAWFKLLKRKNRSFKFFAICENSPPEDIVTRVIVNGAVSQVIPIIEPVTLSGEGGDDIDDFAGLYEFTITVPKIPVCSRMQIQVSYTVKNHLKLQYKKYSFVIYPKNYGANVKKIEIYLKSQQLPMDNLQLQSADNKHGLQKTAIFQKSIIKNNPMIEVARVADLPFYVNGDSIYFIQFEYKKDK